ncbi:disulfide reductase [Blastocystis sp. subtype 4]|uniref:disulfide reductase n=1 Tax=Blastocystis sp. subtype 4 TaxID=944170 RepID=UPI000711AC1B|nr:disulfide reductase [Blastocystis sp. subtype 4]KNB45802.1 disulfide reductase [Blastocystis sp. subtype 4]|eukprot:XP_014529245.1 disulfide reductase [Blastocystis sp. subtype 4]
MLRASVIRRFMSSFPKGRKIVIVGGVAGGGSAAARLRRLDEIASITVFEKGPYNAFANCGLPYYVGGVIPQEKSLLVSSQKQFREYFNVDVKTNHEVVKINRKEKTVLVKDLASNKTFEVAYDKLILSPGSRPFIPPINGVNAPGVFQLRDIPDSRQIKAWIETRNAKKAVIVGGGFIGLEMAENLKIKGLDVTVIEQAPHVMPNLSDELATVLESKMKEKGIHVLSGCSLKEIISKDDSSLELKCGDGSILPCDLVLMSVGVVPNSELARNAGLELGVKNCIKVDDHMTTSDKDILAVGDVVQVKDYITGFDVNVPLAGPANRQGRIAADVLCGLPSYFRGVQGTSVCGMFDLCVAMTGHTPASLLRSNAMNPDDIGIVSVHSPNHANYYPGSSMIHLNLTFNKRTGQVLGGQAVGTAGVDKRIDVISSYIHMNGTVTDLVQAELCYSPPYGAAKDIVNLAGMVAENICRGLLHPVTWVQSFNEDTFKLDTRDTGVFNKDPLPGFTNVPLGTIRDNLNKLPKDKIIDVSCRIGRTAYYACRILEQNGYNVRHLPGGWNTYRLLPNKKY